MAKLLRDKFKFLRDEFNLAVPQTHVLVIGVNSYDYLKGGTRSGQGIATHMGLGQLTAPVLSAAAVAAFFEQKYFNPDAPIGTIAALLSTRAYVRPDRPAPVQVDSPTFDNIRTYTQLLANRMDAHRDSVGVIYFCGHGIEPSGLLLIPEDFGDNALDPWNKAINATATYENFAQMKAKTQLFLIDACRESPLDASDAALKEARASGSLGQSLIGVIPGRPYLQRSAPLITAASIGQKAYAPSGSDQLSFFADALLTCFARGGAERFDGQHWIVTTDSLGRNMKERLQRVKLKNGATAACDTGGRSNFTVDLHRFTGSVSVLARVTTDPSAALAQAVLALDDSVQQPRRRETPAQEPWETEVLTEAHSTWRLEASLPAGAPWQTRVIQRLKAHPPLFSPVIRW
jgi:hypothetical protein